jgi:monofunctional biosynthetic peptidoglycan transglycosylase
VPSSAKHPARPTTARPAALPRWRRALIWARRAVEAGTMVVGLSVLVLWCSVPDVERLVHGNPTSTAFIDLRREQARAAGKPFELAWTWKPRGLISKYLRLAVIYAEDVNFYKHEGVDWDALEKAAARNWDKGEYSAGGSTITQQLAKNLFLSPEKSLLRKARELWITYALEDHLDKNRILEIYLNVVEWGDGVFGAEAAARKWYGRSAASLAPWQAARLAVALPNPRTRAPGVKDKALDEKAARILRLMRRDRIIDAAQRQEGMIALGLEKAAEVVIPVPVPTTTPVPAPEKTVPEVIETEETEGPVTAPSP